MTPPNLTSPPPPSEVRFSIDHFAAFWSDPDSALVAQVVAPDVVGDWPGDPEPVRGVDAYTERIAEVLRLVPDLRLEVAEHASNGEFLFVRWIAHGTGAAGPFELSGMDRIRVRDGRVTENIIRYDTAAFEAAVGGG